MLKLEASESITKLKASNHMDMDPTLGLSDSTESYGLSSPFSLPPFDSPAPLPLPENVPPFCVFPPSFTPQPPSTTVPPPRSHTPPPPPFHFTPTVPIKSPPPSPPISIPSPPTYSPSPNPPENVPGPPGVTPSPPYYGPSPPKLVPTPPVFQPPMVHPPPSAPAPPNRKPEFAVWCVAKPTVPDAIIQEALDYACGSGADCGSIRPNGPCFQPNTMYAHASYAFNSYWQRSKEAGGTCDFGGTAMLVTVDPSE
ncbi:hypothetical protein L1049_025027 [Liquidambar formosana]|uniref:X8 domain-containing protein n=1 Tax=Liquidambar formosana TaxID=63359 RepID=A0AAP0S1K2_LIQFO